MFEGHLEYMTLCYKGLQKENKTLLLKTCNLKDLNLI